MSKAGDREVLAMLKTNHHTICGRTAGRDAFAYIYISIYIYVGMSVCNYGRMT